MSFYSCMRALCVFYVKCLNRYELNGSENLIENVSVVVCANHLSNFDVVLLGVAYHRPIRFMAKDSLFKTKLGKWFFEKLGAFPVARGENDLGAIRNSLRILNSNEALGIFPEGTRVREGKVSDPKGGCVLLAHKTSTPIQPVRIQYIKRRFIFGHFSVTVAPIVRTEDLGITSESQDYKAAGEELIRRINQL